MRNDWCYVHYLNNTKPKGIFKRIYYWMWKMCGVSPSNLIAYQMLHTDIAEERIKKYTPNEIRKRYGFPPINNRGDNNDKN